MLVQEQRKLQDEDMKKVHMRAKRLATKKKYQILEKEDNDKKKLEEVRRKEQKLIDFRYRNRVQSIINEDKFNRSLDDWGKKGYS